MSETATTLFQPGVAINDAPPEEPEGSSNGNRRALLALAGLGLVAVVGVAVYFLFFTGGSDPAPAAPAATQSGPSAAPSAPVAPVPDKPAALPKISAKNFGTDPFHALISVPAVGAATTGGTTTAGGSTASDGTTTDTGSTSGSTAGTTTPTTTAPAPSTAYRFQVVKVASDNSSVDAKVNGKTYKNLQAGEVFGKIFKVRFIGGAVNSFQIGDEVFNVSGAKAVTISN
jgi:hypothetical protein